MKRRAIAEMVGVVLILLIAGLVIWGIASLIREQIAEQEARGACQYFGVIKAGSTDKRWNALAVGLYKTGEPCSLAMNVSKEFYEALSGK